MYAQQAGGVEAVPTWLVLDNRTLFQNGLGMIRPHTPKAALRKYVRSGYIHRSDILEGLAREIGVSVEGLLETVRVNNADSVTGVDSQFAKGTSPFGHQYGDPKHKPTSTSDRFGRARSTPSPSPTPLGTALGMKTDDRARVLDASGDVIPGLYAAGNDADSPMAAEYPGAGGQVGAGMTFGSIAARDAASRTVQVVRRRSAPDARSDSRRAFLRVRGGSWRGLWGWRAGGKPASSAAKRPRACETSRSARRLARARTFLVHTDQKDDAALETPRGIQGASSAEWVLRVPWGRLGVRDVRGRRRRERLDEAQLGHRVEVGVPHAVSAHRVALLAHRDPDTRHRLDGRVVVVHGEADGGGRRRRARR